MAWSVREGVELFHLALLAELGTRLGKNRYVIKGGCNLRFFFRSVRYSEDLDLDVAFVSKETLKKAVGQVLGSKSLARTLAASGIVVPRSSAPKQTEVTQRWKIGLTIDGVSAHTKVEFSRRGIEGEAAFEPIDPALTAYYGLSPILATHYTRQTAIQHKVSALIGRAETQARDVFDLHLLLTGDAVRGLRITNAQLDEAIDRALSIDFDAFKSQVVAFLPSDQQGAYTTVVWEQMVERVVELLERAK